MTLQHLRAEPTVEAASTLDQKVANDARVQASALRAAEAAYDAVVTAAQNAAKQQARLVLARPIGATALAIGVLQPAPAE